MKRLLYISTILFSLCGVAASQSPVCTLQPRGNWAVGVVYTCGAVVRSGTCSWMARVTTTSQPSDTNFTWMKSACDGGTGSPGSPGTPGQAATITVGQVTTMPPESPVTVNNSGTAQSAIFNFGIPQGKTGQKGSPGIAASIAAGSVQTLPAGSPAWVTNSGTQTAAVFDFGIPQGSTGAPGPVIPGLQWAVNPDGTTTLTLNGVLAAIELATTGESEGAITIGGSKCTIQSGKWVCTPVLTSPVEGSNQ